MVLFVRECREIVGRVLNVVSSFVRCDFNKAWTVSGLWLLTVKALLPLITVKPYNRIYIRP